jgi:hypothetical protein
MIKAKIYNIGDQIRNFTILEVLIDENFPVGCYSYKAICSLCNRVDIFPYHKIKNNKSCGCSKLNRMNGRTVHNYKDLKGKVFGSLKVLDRISEIGHDYIMWNCLCDPKLGGCGKIFCINGRSLRYPGKSSCGCIKKHRKAKTNLKFPAYERIPGKYWAGISSRCKKSGTKLEVSIEYCWELLKKQDFKCALTNLPIDMFLDIKKITASLDRKMSCFGYIQNNVQWVHKDVNIMKFDFNQDYLLALCELVYKKEQGYTLSEYEIEEFNNFIPRWSRDNTLDSGSYDYSIRYKAGQY